MDYLSGIALVVVLYLVYMSQPRAYRSKYRSSTLSAWGAFPTRSKLLID